MASIIDITFPTQSGIWEGFSLGVVYTITANDHTVIYINVLTDAILSDELEVSGDAEGTQFPCTQ